MSVEKDSTESESVDYDETAHVDEEIISVNSSHSSDCQIISGGYREPDSPMSSTGSEEEQTSSGSAASTPILSPELQIGQRPDVDQWVQNVIRYFRLLKISYLMKSNI